MTGPALALAGCALLLAVSLFSLLIAGLRLRRRRRLAPTHHAPMSIVCPVCGLEPFIEKTLASAFTLEHPGYEILVCAERTDDPVVPVVQRLMARHLAVPARLLIGADPVSANPKLNNCVKE